MASNNNDAPSLDNQKRKLCKDLALLLKAQAIIDGFLADTKRLELPADWNEAVSITRRDGDITKMQQSIRKTTSSKAYAEIVAFARKDAEKLSLSDIADGRTVEMGRV